MRPAVFSWLVRDTFRQARASRVTWLVLGATSLCVAVCLSIDVNGPKALRPEGEIELQYPDGRPIHDSHRPAGTMTLAFGGLRLGLFRDVESQVHFLQALLARWVAGGAGILFALLWTAGLIPEFLSPAHAPLLIAKPPSRWVLLLGKYLGVVAFVAAQAVLFVGATWLALGVRTGVWAPGYLLCIPILTLHFAVFMAFSTLLAVWTRHGVACAFGALLFWALCLAMNQGRHVAVARSQVPKSVHSEQLALRGAREAAYWILPKPIDFQVVLEAATGAQAHFRSSSELEAVRRAGAFHAGWSLATSALFGAIMLAIAAFEFEKTDY